jgi:hypothetical protein
VKNLVFLLEEPSAKDLLQGLLPRLIPNGPELHFLVFEGKQDLEKQLVRKLRGRARLDSGFVVLRDQDAADCKVVKNRLLKFGEASGCKPLLVRVACRELEAWCVGDLHAVAEAFGKPQLKAQANKEQFRDPDRLVRPVESLRAFIPDYQKRDGARRVGPLLEVSRSRSRSFKAFCTGVIGLASTK